MTGTGLLLQTEHVSAFAFQPTVERLLAAIEAAGMRVFAQIDHAAGAHEAGLAMPPTIVLIYGNPKGGTPIMLAAPRSALDLPLRVLIREADGGVVVSFYPITALLGASEVPAELAARLEPAQHLVLKTIQA
jgi:uncharacterized protein (DUF302 family)